MKIQLRTIVVLSTIFIVPAISWGQADAEITTSKEYYHVAKQEIENMLSGKSKLSYERSIYLIENAWWDNTIGYGNFQKLISYGAENIAAIKAQATPSKQEGPSSFSEALQQKRKKDGGFVEKAKANYAIYRYMTDTTFYIDSARRSMRYHLPYQYATTDPLGTTDWTNTQVGSMLLSGHGNCYAFVSLFKIYSERLQSGANICTAPGHVYIAHKDENGTKYNVEVSSKAFPGTGTLSTLTHTTKESIENNISLRELDLKQSVALCLVYLAKGYEHKFSLRADDGFMMDCAEAALRFDSLNLNAMLLKAEILENKIMARNSTIAQLQSDRTFHEYNDLITHLFKLGYREMPLDMKNLLIKGWTRDSVAHLATRNYLPVQKTTIGTTPTRYASLSWGLFDEEITTKPIERYGRTLYNTKQHKITGFAKEQVLYNNYNFDPILFALNVDPLAHKFPQWSPYAAMGDNPILNIDPDGRAFFISNGGPVNKDGQAFFKILNARSGGVFQMDKKTGEVTFAKGKTLADVGKGGSAELAKAVASGIGANTQSVYFRAVNKDAGVDFDQFKTGKVDVADLKAMDNNSQAALMGHFITERYATDGYEQNKESIIGEYNKAQTPAEKMKTSFWKSHSEGIKTETNIITEVSGYQTNGSREDLIDVDPTGKQYFEYGNGVRMTYDQAPDRTISNGTLSQGQ